MFLDALEGLDFLLHLALTKSSWQGSLVLHIIPSLNEFLFNGSTFVTYRQPRFPHPPRASLDGHANRDIQQYYHTRYQDRSSVFGDTVMVLSTKRSSPRFSTYILDFLKIRFSVESGFLNDDLHHRPSPIQLWS